MKQITIDSLNELQSVAEAVLESLDGRNVVAFFAPMGAGKTTLIKLLTRLYDPTDGCILLDGHDLREYDVHALYDLFGIIFQDFGKYAVTVGENIAFGDVHRTLHTSVFVGANEFLEISVV